MWEAIAVVVSAVSAVVAIWQAAVAKAESKKAQGQAERANKLGHTMTRLEADRDILKWAGEVIETLSDAQLLARTNDTLNMVAEEALILRSRLYALRDIGALYLANSYEEQKKDDLIRAILLGCAALDPDNYGSKYLIVDTSKSEGCSKPAQDQEKGSKTRKNHILSAQIGFVEAMRGRIDTVRLREQVLPDLDANVHVSTM